MLIGLAIIHFPKLALGRPLILTPPALKTPSPYFSGNVGKHGVNRM